MASVLRLTQWAPDQSAFDGRDGEALNVIPATGGYRSFPAFEAYSNALASRAQGGFYVRNAAGLLRVFAGDASKLYELDGDTWTDVSGAVYATPADGRWVFDHFGKLVLATNGIDNIQAFDMDAGTAFANLGGSPPTARYLAAIREFVMLGWVAGVPYRLRWSAFNNAEDWTISASTQADQQDLADGGPISGIVGGEYGLVFQSHSVKRLTYIGPPLIWQIDEIARGIGTIIPGSIATHGQVTFFMDVTGLYAVVGGERMVPVGSQRVDRYFWDNVDMDNLHRVSAAVDPVTRCYVLSFPNTSASAGTPNELLIYHIDLDRFAHALPGDLEMIFPIVTQSGFTLEDLDNYGSGSQTLETLPFSLDSSVWAGVPRPLLAGFNTAHKLVFANGAAMEATIDTLEFQPVPGRRAKLRAFRPLVDGTADVSGKVGTRTMLTQAVTFTASVPANIHGIVPCYVNSRYFRIRLILAAGGTWHHVLGVDEIEISRAEKR